jgi:hypothetical protein
MRRDPFESILPSSVVFGGAFLVVAIIKLVLRILVGAGDVDVAHSQDAFLPVFIFLLGFAVAIGPVVAFARRRMRRERSYRAKNFVTGGLVAACYSLGCLVVFSAGMGATEKIAVGTITLVGVWWAVASALNELFPENVTSGRAGRSRHDA